MSFFHPQVYVRQDHIHLESKPRQSKFNASLDQHIPQDRICEPKAILDRIPELELV